MKFSIENILKDDRKEIVAERNSCSNASSGLSSLEQRSLSEMGTRSSSPDSSSSCCSDDVSQDNNHRRPRTAITIWQRDRLEVLFGSQRYPAAEKIELISEQLGLPQHVVKVWFQNRRAKLRKEGIKRRKPNSLTTSPSRDHLHHLATVVQAAEFPRHINDKEIELVHSRASNGSTERLHSMMEPPNSCPCCIPSLGHKQYSKPTHPDYLHTLPIHYSDRYLSKPYPFNFREQHSSMSPMMTDGNAKCCCINCRVGTFYAKY